MSKRRPKDRSHWGDMAVGLAAPRPDPAAAREKLARELSDRLHNYFVAPNGQDDWGRETAAETVVPMLLAFAESVEKMR